MIDTIANRYEIVFIYDVEEGNPNGDPAEDNRPRMDNRTGENIVTDVRLKRTVRDYLQGFTDEEIFVRSVETGDEGKLKSKTEMVEQVMEKELDEASRKEVEDALFKRFIDLRLFGATIAGNNVNVSQTGPTQFKMGRSLHKVDDRFIRGSTVLPSEEDKTQGTLTDRYDLPYSLIGFYGVVNENSAEDTMLREEDVEKLFEALWDGTKSLITGSKMEHKPQHLLVVEHSESSHIGGLDNKVDYSSNKEDMAIRHIDEVDLDFGKLNDAIEEKDSVEKVMYKSNLDDFELPDVETEEFEW